MLLIVIVFLIVFVATLLLNFRACLRLPSQVPYSLVAGGINSVRTTVKATNPSGYASVYFPKNLLLLTVLVLVIVQASTHYLFLI